MAYNHRRRANHRLTRAVSDSQQRLSSSLRWLQPAARLALTLWRLRLPLLLICAALLLFLLTLYQRPLTLRQDIGVQPLAIEGLYEPERSQQLSYAYSNGQTNLRLPQSGAGQYLVELRLAGPGTILPVAARLSAAHQQIDLGQLRELRHYHLLLADQRGDLAFSLGSATTSIQGDERQLGALIDWLAVRSIGPLRPPMRLLLSMPLLLLALAGAVAQLATRYRWQTLLCLLTGALIGLGYGLGRGQATLPAAAIVLLIWLAVGLVLLLSHFEELRLSRPLLGVAGLALAWRAALAVLGALAVRFSTQLYPWADRLSVGDELKRVRLTPRALLLSGWLQWDSEHYLSIAEQGYRFLGQRWPNIAFFPLYPLLIRLTLPLTAGDSELAALLVAHAALLAALLLLYDLLQRDFGPALAARTIVLLLIFPAALFLAAGYSESLALLLVVAAVWALRRERWWLAGLAGALLALTRLPGVLLTPVLLLAYLQRRSGRRIGPDALAALLPLTGLALFMLYQWQRFGTPTAFLQAQQRWNNQLSPPWTMPLAIVRQLTTSPDWPIVVPHALVWLGFIGLALLALRRLPLVYSLTALLLLLPPYLSSYPRSMARYVLIAFPAFVALACWAEPVWRRRLLLALMLPLLAIGVLLFVNGFWVA